MIVGSKWVAQVLGCSRMIDDQKVNPFINKCWTSLTSKGTFRGQVSLVEATGRRPLDFPTSLLDFSQGLQLW